MTTCRDEPKRPKAAWPTQWELLKFSIGCLILAFLIQSGIGTILVKLWLACIWSMISG